MKGIIYKYTSPENKVYIGQTINEKNRRASFRQQASYAGVKIDFARCKFGPESFKYEVLLEIVEDDVVKLKQLLNKKENEFIRLYDSANNGYNSVVRGKIDRLVDKYYEEILQTKEYKVIQDMIKDLTSNKTEDMLNMEYIKEASFSVAVELIFINIIKKDKEDKMEEIKLLEYLFANLKGNIELCDMNRVEFAEYKREVEKIKIPKNKSKINYFSMFLK